MSDRWPRWMHRLYARTHHYFWLPCPRCGEMFGGHEVGEWPEAVLVAGSGLVVVCPSCDDQIKRRAYFDRLTVLEESASLSSMAHNLAAKGGWR